MWHLAQEWEMVVNQDRTKVEGSCNSMCACDIAGPTTGGEPIRRVVCERNGLSLIVERECDQNGTEDLVLDDFTRLVRAND
jgi:hypothetical protein